MKADLTVLGRELLTNVLKKLNETGEKILFVVNEEKILLGTLTDGDVRRYIIRNGNLRGTAYDCCNKTPIFLSKENLNPEMIKQLMIKNRVEVLPIVDENKKIVDYITWLELFGEKWKNFEKIDIPVVVMAGGKGTRLDPLTKIIPKPLIPVGDKTMVEHIIDYFRNYGVSRFILTLNYKADLIRSYFANLEKDYELEFIQEKDFLGTAGSLYYLKKLLKNDFIVTNCDILLKIDYKEFYEFHKKSNSAITIATALKNYKIPYGVVEIEAGGTLKRLVEKPEYSFQINTGVYLFNEKVFKYLEEEKTDMPELIVRLLKFGEKVYVFPVNEDNYIDMGEWEEYKKTLRRMGLE